MERRAVQQDLTPSPTDTNRSYHPIFYKFPRWRGHSSGEFRIEFPGVFTRPKFYHHFTPVPKGYHETKYIQGGEQYVEWIFMLEALYSERNAKEFIFAEIGAGWGAWLIRGAASYRQISETPMKLIAAEADRTHYEYIFEHFEDNGIDPNAHDIVWAGVSDRRAIVPFKVETSQAFDYGQHIMSDETDDRKVGDMFMNVQCLTLEDVIGKYEKVDFLHMDIQGEELKVLANSTELLKNKVVRMQIATHSVEIHEAVVELLRENNFELVFNYGWREVANVEYWGPIEFRDGSLSVINPRLMNK